MGNPRLPELEALRGIAIAAVVGLHVSFGFLLAAPAGSTAAAATLVVHLLTTFATPLFVALSLAGLSLGYADTTGTARDSGSFFARRAWRILPPYVFWTVLTLLRNSPTALGHPTTLGWHLVTGSASYHLYFVPLICAYYLLWPLLSPLAIRARQDDRAAWVIAALGLGLTLLIWRASAAGLLPNSALTLPLFWLGYATLGIAAAPALARRFVRVPRPAPWRLPWAALAAGAAVVMVHHVRSLLGPAPDPGAITLPLTIFQTPMMAYALAAMTVVVSLVAGPLRGTRLWQALGRSSYGMYLSHLLVLEIVQRFVGSPADPAASAPTWIAALLAQWAGCVMLSHALVRTMERVPGLAIFAGGATTRTSTRAPVPSPEGLDVSARGDPGRRRDA